MLKEELEFKIKEMQLPHFKTIFDRFSKETIHKVVDIMKMENFLPGQ